MVSLKRFSLLLFGLLLTVFVAACSNPLSGNTANTGSTTTGSNTTTNTTSGSTKTYGNSAGMATPTSSTMGKSNTMATPTTAMGNNNMGTNNMGTSNALIHTTQVTLNGTKITVLTNAKGMILYYKLDDPAGMSGCTGMCAAAWPPVLATNMNMMAVTSSMQLPHKLTIVKTANGNQVAYDNHVLYTYAGDMTAGQFTGRGMDKVWYLVSLAL